MSKPYCDVFIRVIFSDYEKIILSSKMNSVNRFTFLLSNIINECEKAHKENKSKDFQKSLNRRWEVISIKHKRAWERYTKEYKKLFKNKNFSH